MPSPRKKKSPSSRTFEYDLHDGGELRPPYEGDYRPMDDDIGRYSQRSSPRRSSSLPRRGSSLRGSGKFSSPDLLKYGDNGGEVIDGYAIAGDGSDESEEIYVVKQKYGYMSLIFSLAQTIILGTMMIQCGIAPLTINPMFGPYPDALSEWGGKNSINILEDGEYWRLLTPILLHAGVIHLLCNISVQIELGVFFEREWGSFIWLTVYIVSAIGSSILSVIYMPNAVSVGSSGAVMGLFGGKLAEVICRACEAQQTKQQRVGHQVRKEQCAGVMCSVIVVMAFSFIPYVDWAAHLGGLISGFTIGLVIFSMEIENICLRMLWFLAGVIATCLYFLLSTQYMFSEDIEVEAELRDVCGYYQQFFDDYECNCMREEYNWANNNNNQNSGDQ